MKKEDVKIIIDKKDGIPLIVLPEPTVVNKASFIVFDPMVGFKRIDIEFW